MNKKITLEKLAAMVERGFAEVKAELKAEFKKEIAGVNAKLDILTEQVDRRSKSVV